MNKDSHGYERAKKMRQWRDRRGGLPPGRLPPLPSALAQPLEAWLNSQRRAQLSPASIQTRRLHVSRFLRWCEKRNVTAPSWISAGLIDEWLDWLRSHQTSKGSPLADSSRCGIMAAVRTFLAFLKDRKLIDANPLETIQVSKGCPNNLPVVLSEAAITAVLAEPDTSDPLGIRDRAMLELFYSSALRRTEMARLALADVETGTWIIRVRHAKGRKQRIVPIGRVAAHWLHRYLEEVRPLLVPEGLKPVYCFLTGYGDCFAPPSLGHLTKRYLLAAAVTLPGSCHLFRHACATHMLDHGADLRSIQTLLGHSRLDTTEIYTHVTPERICRVHQDCHPRG